jgi:hypothetical protein
MPGKTARRGAPCPLCPFVCSRIGRSYRLDFGGVNVDRQCIRLYSAFSEFRSLDQLPGTCTVWK